jgi:hypothetical protein
MANLLARAAAVEERLALFAELRLLTYFRRRPNVPRRWVAGLCQHPGSTGSEEIVLDTVHDAEVLAAGLESAFYGLSTRVREWADSPASELLEDMRADSDRAESAMTARAQDRYGEALNTLREFE